MFFKDKLSPLFVCLTKSRPISFLNSLLDIYNRYKSVLYFLKIKPQNGSHDKHLARKVFSGSYKLLNISMIDFDEAEGYLAAHQGKNGNMHL